MMDRTFDGTSDDVIMNRPQKAKSFEEYKRQYNDVHIVDPYKEVFEEDRHIWDAATKAAEERQCPHWRCNTDGVHVVLVDRCYHPDCEKWRKANEQNT